MENEPQDAYLPEGDSEALQPFDVRDQSSRRGMMWLVGGFIFLLVLAFIIMKLFSSGTRDRDQTPRILADNSPYKEVPVERGGEQTPNQGMEVYQKLNGTLKEEAVSVLPATETPLPKPQANIVIKEPSAPKPITTPPVQVKLSSDYVVQVASLRSNKEAISLWEKLSDKMDDVIKDAHFADIKRVDLGDKGIYYRLRVSGLADKDAANSLCARLKTQEQNCFVTKK